METVITVWEKWYDDTWNFNHISDGYDPTLTAPVPMCENQKKSWKPCKWRSRKASLIDNVVIENITG